MERQGSPWALDWGHGERVGFDLELEREPGVHVASVTRVDACGRDAGVVLFVEDIVHSGHHGHPLCDGDFRGEVPRDVGGDFSVGRGIVCSVVIGHEGSEEGDLGFLEAVNETGSNHVFWGERWGFSVIGAAVEFGFEKGDTGVQVQVAEFLVEVAPGDLSGDANQINLSRGVPSVVDASSDAGEFVVCDAEPVIEIDDEEAGVVGEPREGSASAADFVAPADAGAGVGGGGSWGGDHRLGEDGGSVALGDVDVELLLARQFVGDAESEEGLVVGFCNVGLFYAGG